MFEKQASYCKETNRLNIEEAVAHEKRPEIFRKSAVRTEKAGIILNSH